MYNKLQQVFKRALEQASSGKGKERHANGLPFEKQRMQGISELLDNVDGMAFQVIKKVLEARQLPTVERQVAELLGAINYAAGMIVFLEKGSKEEDLVSKEHSVVTTLKQYGETSKFDVDETMKNVPRVGFFLPGEALPSATLNADADPSLHRWMREQLATTHGIGPLNVVTAPI